jgi:hypothetical protein
VPEGSHGWSVATLLVTFFSACRNSETLAKAGANTPPGSASATSAAVSLEDLGAEFRRLRSVPGHFGGAPGQWNDAVDRWGGRKHVIMKRLQARLGVPATSRAKVIASMGEPDEVRPSREASTMLVYYWRGRHDFLYFVVRDGQVVHCDWWMAGE